MVGRRSTRYQTPRWRSSWSPYRGGWRSRGAGLRDWLDGRGEDLLRPPGRQAGGRGLRGAGGRGRPDADQEVRGDVRLGPAARGCSGLGSTRQDGREIRAASFRLRVPGLDGAIAPPWRGSGRRGVRTVLRGGWVRRREGTRAIAFTSKGEQALRSNSGCGSRAAIPDRQAGDTRQGDHS